MGCEKAKRLNKSNLATQKGWVKVGVLFVPIVPLHKEFRGFWEFKVGCDVGVVARSTSEHGHPGLSRKQV